MLDITWFLWGYNRTFIGLALGFKTRPDKAVGRGGKTPRDKAPSGIDVTVAGLMPSVEPPVPLRLTQQRGYALIDLCTAGAWTAVGGRLAL